MGRKMNDSLVAKVTKVKFPLIKKESREQYFLFIHVLKVISRKSCYMAVSLKPEHP